MNDKLIYDIEDAEKSLTELVGADFRHKKVGYGYVQRAIHEGIRALRAAHEHLFREIRGEICTSKTLLVLDLKMDIVENEYRKHLDHHCDFVEEVCIAAEKLGVSIGREECYEIAKTIGGGLKYLFDGRYWFMVVD